MDLSIKQREILAQFFCNYAIAWIAGGIIAPFTTGWNTENLFLVMVISIGSVAFSVMAMLFLSGKEVKK